MLFISERLRGQRMAGRLLAMAEKEAKVRGCIGTYIDTVNPVARRTYERAGLECSAGSKILQAATISAG
ncbi:GNAT family N-acetyltransferase [Rhizobium glycinendophyticum]|uniref:GNAT family N-acetyltransferase n=2 Tax=Rhizobium glycinendophyticum TaxID=2589807 RepID=A0A504V3S8_9HYPH|nr:GNAT family N-acetyltransferase [Rhizobium glycinendophyticum]